MHILKAAVATLVLLAPQTLAARDVAVVIDQQDYRSLEDLPRDARISSMANALRKSEFEVIEVKNATLSELRAALFTLNSTTDNGADRVVIVVRGHLLSDPRQTWLLSQEARAPDRFDIGAKALPIPLFDEALDAAAGRAVLALIQDPRPIEDVDGLDFETLTYTPLQGTTVLKGSSRDVQAALNNLLAEGGTTRQIERGIDDLEVTGFVSGSVAFTPREPTEARSDNRDISRDSGEVAFWNAVREIGSDAALRSYLERYPNGQFAANAKGLLSQRENDREARLKEREEALNLSREQRRDVQRDLSLLGFDPRGIDGVFGPATRSAISAWQDTQGREAHGYLDRDQLQVMQEFALRRAAELEEEARRRREIEDARDRAFWQDTGARNTEAGYRSYLKEFPDGLFADIAREELDTIEAERRAEMDARERAAWDEAREKNTVQSYRAFLNAHPDGVFADAAKTRIDQLTNESDNNEETRKRLQAAENAVAGNSAVRLLVENRLRSLGFDTGKVDGAFDRDARRAIRRFQKSRDLSVTGFVDQQTMVQLLLGR
ncbi:peptidoglycan-binding domain-containing protein [Cognatishimia maritima]|uniref:Putative peptidoglycan binding domain-containing protein n=1 Tax=Cognatishimia maritima TaxID=870908 RepID=A0A1M5SP77_9RHOB|nr:peptidoglycan-binding domain-containing protein [Cognatishimia maritima]SHH40286.1 Putative peptidoglycan binding domain-containing protein [Cognatishimia maritima]